MRLHISNMFYVNYLNVINNIHKNINEEICNTRLPCDKIKYKINDSV